MVKFGVVIVIFFFKINITQEYLTLEPIGSVFLVFFGSVMLIQFTAMLFHRLGTLTHLLSTTTLNWYFSKGVSSKMYYRYKTSVDYEN